MRSEPSANSPLQRWIAMLMAIVMYISPIIAIAENAREGAIAAGREGRALGELFGSKTPQPKENTDGSFNLGSTENQFGEEVPLSVNIKDLYPGTNSAAGSDLSLQFPGNQQVDVERFKSADNDSLRSDGAAYQSSLYQDAVQDNPTTTMGAAYKILMDGASRPKVDFRNDADFEKSRQQIDNAEELTGEFSDCSIARGVVEQKDEVRIPEYKFCERITDDSEECKISHDYSTDVIEIAQGDNLNIKHCDDGSCFLGWIGKVGDDYWSGNCVEKTQHTSYRVVNPEAITSARIVYAKYDDHMQIYLGEEGAEEKVWQGPKDYFPLDDGGRCELGKNWEQSLSVDVTPHFKDVEPGAVVRFRIRAAISGRGEAYARLQINYDPKKIISRDNWVPSTETCIGSAKSTADGFVQGGYECTQMPELDENGCTMTSTGVRVCASDLSEAPVDVNRLCKEVSVEAKFDHYYGQADCFINREGVEVCPTIEKAENAGELSSCKKFEDDNQCRFISSECIEGTEGEQSGRCYVTSEKWDCGKTVEISDYHSSEDIQCDGEFLCQGDECGSSPQTESTSFTKAATLLQAAQFMAMDGQCQEVDVEENRNCEVFAGDDYWCKKVGLPELGVDAVDCCDQPVEVGPGQYIRTMASIGVMDASFMSINPDMSFSAARGSYQALRDPVVNGVTELTKPFTSAVETVTGPVKEAIAENITKPVGDFLVSLKEKISQQLAEFFTEQGVSGATGAGGGGGGAAAGNAAGKQAAEEGASQATQLMGTAGNMLGTVMGVYSAVMLTYMALQIIYECEDQEIELAVKRELKACTPTGSWCDQKVCVAPSTFGCLAYACFEYRYSFCCYNSPLSRIVMEQAVPQLRGANGFGSAKNPQCGGISFTELENLDWDQIDLSEWTALLTDEGMIGANEMNLDDLTGAGHPNAMPDIYGERSNSLERTQQRLESGSVDDARIEKAQNYPFDPR
ncbi:conjugal transfer mating pair stabilization protein TraN [Hydrocarboniclastica marina]|uniref:Conjugal transfer mating pair stabilization protein TraN n=1 Tax=Hydrocarboniclastica marina TaxID=2259620 RepID=A0A4P7XLL8_9ALTE|nr:conjugal transfer mating pair stabilization protein TraN [Hydrocarboniclastica marina]QCF28146.1 conjugal transfer mating pair stabilization protein TraN [Hydrocarboniclastica marina]